MGERYRQLGLDERIEIYRLHAGGRSQHAIAALLGRSPATISRELRRNGRKTGAWPGGYDPARADRLALRRRHGRCRYKLVRQPDLRDLVRDRLAMGMSPEQIAGRLAREAARTVISHESIYRYVYFRSAQKDYWHRLLPRRKSRRGRPGKPGSRLAGRIRHRVSIHDRPTHVDDRTVPGHWEADTMLFCNNRQNILVAHERTSRLTLLVHTPDRKAATTANALVQLLQPFPPALRQSVTFDNGSEFAEHHRIARTLNLRTYFCDTHSPWQKGGVENAIGRLRRSLPSPTDLSTLPPDTIRQHQHSLNHTPRKCLDFQSPAELASNLITVALQT